ncbi:MAG: phosphoglycerate dehydrogenase [Armatimonadetes bacterium]|nr:phosphoglycerate dehydrogenase [Armatimonadota bacterium]
MKVLVTEAIGERGIEILSQAGQVDVKLGLNGPALAEAIAEYSVLVVRSATQVTADIIACADNLKIVGRCGVGVDNIDVEAATKRGILVVNSPAGNTLAAAEHTISLMFSLARHIPDAVASMRAGKWDRKTYVGTELHDKVLGVVGFGKIGVEVARRALGLDMKVLAFDPQMNTQRAQGVGVEVVTDLDDLLRQVDYVTFHLPLNKFTKGLLSGERIELMKPSAYVINCARGGIVDEAALAEALGRGRLAGAAIDVWEHEPPFDKNPRSPLMDAPRVIPTPHLGASTAEAQENVATDVAQQVQTALRGEPVHGAVNLPQLEAEEHRRLKPYMALAEQLGRFLAQLSEGDKIIGIEMTYLGRLQHEPTAPLSRAVLRGLLDTFIDDRTINYVNVPSVVAEQGIQVAEVRSAEVTTYPAVLRVALTTSQYKHIAEGACFGADPRVVSLDGYNFNIMPYGHLLVWWNHDHPGVIGKVGTLLGDHQVNIAGMQLGRDNWGGNAVSIVSIDGAVSDELLAAIMAIPGMVDVRRVDFGNGDHLAMPVPMVPVGPTAGE